MCVPFFFVVYLQRLDLILNYCIYSLFTLDTVVTGLYHLLTDRYMKLECC